MLDPRAQTFCTRGTKYRLPSFKSNSLADAQISKPFARGEGAGIVDVVVRLRRHARGRDSLEREGHLGSTAVGASPTEEDDGVPAQY